MGITPEEYELLQKRRRARQTALSEAIEHPSAAKAKYRNTRVLVDLGPDGEVVGGHLRLVHQFDSKKEAQFFAELKLRRKVGEIRDLRLQEPFPLVIDGDLMCTFIADFVYDERSQGQWKNIVADVKSKITRQIPLYRLKSKLMQGLLKITVLELM